MDCSNVKSNIKIKEEYVEENEKLPLVDDTQVSHFKEKFIVKLC